MILIPQTEKNIPVNPIALVSTRKWEDVILRYCFLDVHYSAWYQVIKGAWLAWTEYGVANTPVNTMST